jgi:ABC-type branched-subunit amino acid transport system ATPase component
MPTDNDILIANQGTFILNNTATKTTIINAIVALEDTVFSAIRIAGTDVKATYIASPSTAVKAGTIIRPTNAQQFSGVTLTSGSVILVL